MTLRKINRTKSTNLALSIVISEFFWDGIEAACIPRVAFRKAPRGKPRAVQGPEPLDRGQGVGGTSRMKTAVMPDPGTDQVSIGLDEEDQEGLHCFTRASQCLCNERNSVSWSAWIAALRAITTKSIPPRVCCRRRKLSRIRRFRRLRWVAWRMCRLESASPRRGSDLPLLRASTVNRLSADLQGRSKTR